MWTARFEQYVAPARAKPEIWRLIVGIVVVFALYAATTFGALAIAIVTADPIELSPTDSFVTGGTPKTVLLLLGSFIGMALGTLLVARHLHNRPVASLFGPAMGRGFVIGSAGAIGVLLISFLLPFPVEIVPDTPTDLFLKLLPLALLCLALQTGAEELLFRGYLQQQLAARFNHPFIWMLLPSLLFGFLHLDFEGNGDNALLVVAAATLFGLAAADLTRVTGSIGVAWGWHFVNNATAILVVSMEGALSGLSLYTAPIEVSELDPLLVAQDMMLTVIIWAALRLYLARRMA